MRLRQCTVMGGMFVGLVVGAAAPRDAQALINIQLRPVTQTVTVGSVVNVGIYAVSDTPASQLLSALQMIFTWDTSKLQLTGLNGSGGAPLSFSGFLMGPDGINEANPPADGNGIVYALDVPGNPISATAAGTLITTLQFNALAVTPLTPINVLPTAGSPAEVTAVFDGTMPNQMVTGTFVGGTVTIVAVPAPGAAATLLLGALTVGRRRRR